MGLPRHETFRIQLSEKRGRLEQIEPFPLERSAPLLSLWNDTYSPPMQNNESSAPHESHRSPLRAYSEGLDQRARDENSC